jgi:hypothetical protein
MRRFAPFLYLALVAVLFVAGDRLGALALGAAVDASDFRFVRIHRGGLDNDILVVGNSRAVHSVFAPDLSSMLRRNVFNAAFNGMSGEVAEAIVKDYLEHNKPPKAVLIEVSDAVDNPDLVKELRLFARYPGPMRDLVRQFDPWNDVWSTASHLYAFNNEMTLRALYHLHRTDQDWIMYDRPMTPEVLAHIPLGEFKNYHSRPGSVAALRRLVRDLKARDIKPVLYIAPFHPYFHELVPHYAQWVSGLERDLDEPILDMSQMFSDNGNFTDLLHVNIHGSRQVTAAVADRLRQLMPKEVATTSPAAPLTATHILPHDDIAAH